MFSSIFEELGVKHSDRFQYVLPQYDFSKNLNLDKNFPGSINFNSSGSNNLKNTNNLTSSITNNFQYSSLDYYSNKGLKNKFNIYFKNFNSVGKNDPAYKSSPKVEGMGIFEINSSIPLVKEHDSKKEILTPKISFRFNPVNNMKNHSNSSNTINIDNVFAINRLGINDSFEEGKSITVGIDYNLDIETKNNLEPLENIKNKSIGFKLATVFRDEYEDKIPTKSSINQKSSNIFGTINNNLFENLNLKYDFSIDNDLKTFDAHSISSKISIDVIIVLSNLKIILFSSAFKFFEKEINNTKIIMIFLLKKLLIPILITLINFSLISRKWNQCHR